MPRIVVLLDDETSYELKKFPVLLGREHGTCDIVVANAQVSRKHAQIVEQGGQYFVECLGAANRTAVNGKLIEQNSRCTVPLGHGDRIKLGPVKLRFESELPVVEDVTATSGGFEVTENSSATVMGSAAARGFGVFEVRPEEKLRGILKINQSLAGQVELTEIAPRILDVLFDIFPQADRGTIQIRQVGSDRLVPVAQKRRAEGDDESVRLSRTILMKVLDERIGILSADAANDSRFSASESISSLKLHSMMCVPMLDLQGKPFGVINLDTQNPMKRFTDEDLELLLAVASQAANAYENVRLLKSHLEKQKQDAEMKIARSVQKALLPDVLPEVSGWFFYASYDAAQAVGGDYYDCFRIGEHKICLSFGDVAGKGVPGALIMSRVSSVVQNTMTFTDDVAVAIGRINRHMCHNMVAGRFVTYTLAVIDLQSNRMSMVNAGHFPPLIRREDGSLEEFAGGQIGIPIGIMDDYEYEVVERDIAPGDLFLLRTDGVDEAMAPDGSLYTTEKVVEFFRKSHAKTDQIGGELLADVRKHANGREQNDDIAIMTFGRRS